MNGKEFTVRQTPEEFFGDETEPTTLGQRLFPKSWAARAAVREISEKGEARVQEALAELKAGALSLMLETAPFADDLVSEAVERVGGIARSAFEFYEGCFRTTGAQCGLLARTVAAGRKVIG